VTTSQLAGPGRSSRPETSKPTSMGEQVVRSKGCSDGEFMKNKLNVRRPGKRKRDRFGARSRERSGSESSGPVSSTAREGNGLPSVRRRPFGNARPNADADLFAGTGSVPLSVPGAMRRIFRARHWMTCVYCSAEAVAGTAAWMDLGWRSGCIDRLCASRSLVHKLAGEQIMVRKSCGMSQRIGLFVNPWKDMLCRSRPPCRDGPWICQHPCRSQGDRFSFIPICT
jgi:hypothetical protein